MIWRAAGPTAAHEPAGEVLAEPEHWRLWSAVGEPLGGGALAWLWNQY